ncbi:MAG: glycosyltransferase family 4 protein [Desulfobacteraceae bacterium]|nr:glycosyltransferase family 4 protein [Desulfobacteraceae bacterium]
MMSSFQYLKQLVEEQHSIVVLDDFFPNLLSGFRIAEYNWYLRHFPQLVVYSTNPDFDSVHATYAQHYPQHSDRVKPYDDSSLNGCTFVYMNFLNNAHHFLLDLHSRCIPFLMTLYPGGGFGLWEPESDAKLLQILKSPLLLGIIATQNVTLDYLKEKGCKVPVHYIYGGVVHPIYFERRKEYKDNHFVHDSLNICFVAARYMEKGANKGYPQFIEIVHQLIREFHHLKFTVVGNFNADDVFLDDTARKSITFIESLTTADLKDFFLTQDIIISPNRPFLLHQGNFDGFPTGCCVEASLCGVAMICSDELKLNYHYTDGVDIVICRPVSDTIVKAVKNLILDSELLERIRIRGQSISLKIFDPKKQLGKRVSILEKAYNYQKVKWPIKLIEFFKLAKETLIYHTNYIRCIETELSVLRKKHPDKLEQIIAEQTTYIHNIEADLTTRGKYIEELEQTITVQTTHIHRVETELAKLQSLWLSRLKSVGKKLSQLIKSS